MLIAFRNTTVTKSAILAQLRAHAEADEIVKGRYWQDGKGCAIGCTIHGDNHAAYESRFGIPQMLARLEDCVFEGLPNDKAKNWPVCFMSAVQPGSDLSCVGWQFLHWLLTDENVNPGINHPLVTDAVRQCADVLVPLTKGESAAWTPTWTAAESAARSAESAARSAAWSAACAMWSGRSAARSAESAGSAARSAAESAAESVAERAARSAENAARSAAWSVENAAERAAAARMGAAAAWATERAAESAENAAAVFVRMSDRLIALIKAAPQAND